jgi:hypothetical protein
MRFRLTAFGLHLLGSAGVLTLVLGALYLGWYRWPGWYLASALHVVGIVVMVDLVIGPTLTLIVANPGKARRVLVRDVALIVTVQLAALVYGAGTLWGGRPLYYTFSTDSLDIVQASDMESDELARARRENPSFAPYWYSRPRWVWAPLPDNAEEAMHIVNSVVLSGGSDVVDMPRYFKPWQEGLPKLRQQLQPVNDIKYLSKFDKESVRRQMAARGLEPDQRNALIMWGGSRRLVAVFDPDSLELRALLIPG